MFKVILDSNAIVKNPSTLTLPISEGDIIIPPVVVDELANLDSYAASGSTYIPLIKVAIEEGNVSVLRHDDILKEEISSKVRPLSLAEVGFIRAAQATKNKFPKDNVIVTTDDIRLSEKLDQIGITTLTVDEFTKQYITNKPPNAGRITDSVNNVARQQNKYLYTNIIVSVVASIIINLIALNLLFIIGTIKVWGTLLGILSAGLFLFWGRSKYPLGYGFAEVIIGICTAYWVFIPEFAYENLSTTNLIRIVGGLYIIVRGLDNIGKGLKGSKHGNLWESWFQVEKVV